MPTEKDPAEVVAMRIGGNIQTAMGRLGLNISTLADLSGVRRQTAQHWIKGKHLPTGASIPELCALLGIDANTLFGVSSAANLQGDALNRHSRALEQRLETIRRGNPPKESAPSKAPRKSGQRRKAS